MAPGKGSRRVKSMAAAGSWPLPPGLSPVTPHQADQKRYWISIRPLPNSRMIAVQLLVVVVTGTPW